MILGMTDEHSVPEPDQPRVKSLEEADQDQLQEWQRAAADDADEISMVQTLRYTEYAARYWQNAARKLLGPEMFKLALDRAVREDDGPGARAWSARCLNEAFPRTWGTPEVDPTLFAAQGRSIEYFDTTFCVISNAPDAVQIALSRATRRIRLVSEDGGEYADDEELMAALEGVETGFEPSTPNYVSEPTVSGQVVDVYIDTKSAMWPAMMIKIIEIVLDELERENVTEAIIMPAPRED